jgi:hypothetical protein
MRNIIGCCKKGQFKGQFKSILLRPIKELSVAKKTNINPKYKVRHTTYNSYTMYDKQCTMYNVQCTMYNVQRTTYNIQHTTYNIQQTTYKIQQHTTYNIQHTTYNLDHTT